MLPVFLPPCCVPETQMPCTLLFAPLILSKCQYSRKKMKRTRVRFVHSFQKNKETNKQKPSAWTQFQQKLKQLLHLPNYCVLPVFFTPLLCTPDTNALHPLIRSFSHFTAYQSANTAEKKMKRTRVRFFMVSKNQTKTNKKQCLVQKSNELKTWKMVPYIFLRCC